MRRSVILLIFIFSTDLYAQDFEMTLDVPAATEVTTQSSQPTDQLTLPLQTIDQQDIKQAPFQTPAELIEHQSHATVVRSGGRFQPSQIFIRGASSDHTLVLMDGIEVNDPMHPGRGSNLSLLPAGSLSKIEILPSSYGLLYGSDAMGGLVSLSSEDFSSSPQRSLGLEVGRYGYAGMKLNSNDSQLQYGLEFSRDDGFSAKAPRDGEADGHLFGSAHLRTRTHVGASTLTAHARVQFLQNDLDNGIGPQDDDPNHQSDAYQALASVVWDVPLFTHLQSTVSYRHAFHLRKTKNPEDPSHPGSQFESIFLGHVAKAQWLNHLPFQIDKNLPAKLHFGTEWEYENGFSTMEDALFGNTSFPRQSQVSLAAFALAEFQYDRTTLFAGYRVDDHTEFETQGLYNLGMAYQVFHQPSLLRLLANIGTGFKAPSLFQRYSDFGNRDLQPEKSNSLTAGFEFQPHRTVKLSGHFFRNQFEDLIDYDFASNQYINLYQVDLRGWESDFSWQLSSVRVHLLFNELTHQETTGKKLLRRPRHKGTFRLHYEPTSNTGLGFNIRYIGKRLDVDAQGQYLTTPAYTVADLLAQWQIHPKLQIFGRIENILNRNYQEVYGYATSARALFAGLEWSF